MSEHTKPNTEEIDLFTFLKPVADTFKKVFSQLGRYLHLLLKNITLLIAITVITSALGFSLRFILPKAYKSEAVFVSHELPAKVCTILLNNLEELMASKKDKPVLAKKLNISDENAAGITKLRASLMKDSFFINDDDTVRNFFSVTLICNNALQTDSIQKGIVQFLENNTYALKRKNTKEKSLLKLKENLRTKINSLDSLKNIVNNSITPRSQGQGIILGEPVDPVSIYQAEIAYYREQLDIDMLLTTLDNIEIIQPFAATIKPNYPRFNLILLYFFLAGIILAMIIIPVLKR
jgi:hypothetical protein